MLSVYIVCKTESKPCLNVYVVSKKLQNHAICVCSIEKTIKIMLNVYVVGKRLSKPC